MKSSADDFLIPGSWLTPGTDGQRSPEQGAESAGRAVQLLGLHHAPSIIWPHTRTTLPLTAVEPGEANHAMASATSTGRPPWLSALRRWPTSRVANGTAAVMAVMMKPGATALMVMPRPRSSASESTRPMTPALDAA